MKEYWYFTFEYDYLRGRNFIIQLEGSQEETYKKMSKLFKNVKFNQYSSEKAVSLRHKLVCLNETDLKNEILNV